MAPRVPREDQIRGKSWAEWLGPAVGAQLHGLWPTCTDHPCAELTIGNRFIVILLL